MRLSTIGVAFALLMLVVRGQAQGKDSKAIREHIQRIVARPEYAPSTSRSNFSLQNLLDALNERWDKFWKWVGGLFGESAASASPAIQWLFIVVFFAIAVGILVLLLRRLVRFRAERKADTHLIAGEEEPLEAETLLQTAWSDEAEGFARLQEWQQAHRALFLAALALLHRKNVVSYARWRTNGDYLRALRSPQYASLLALFRPFSLDFDRRHYGGRIALERDYLEAREAYLKIEKQLAETPTLPEPSVVSRLKEA